MEQCVENATHCLYDVTVKGKNGRNTKNISNLQFPKTFVGFGSLKNDSVLWPSTKLFTNNPKISCEPFLE